MLRGRRECAAVRGDARAAAQVRDPGGKRRRLRRARSAPPARLMEPWIAAHAWAAYLVIGVVVGFAAGLLGIGGGMVMVPLLVYVLGAEGFPAEHSLHVALATALATIVFTSASSVRAHHKFEAVDWPIVRAMAPGILAGSFAAALIAGFIPT